MDRLKLGEPVAINTGRGVHFALDKVFPELEKRGITNELLERFIVVGEKGAVYAYYKDGDLHEDIDRTLSVPDYLREHVFEIVKNNFADTMFEGEIKESMLSPEKRGDIELGVYKEAQERLVEICRGLIDQYGLQGKYRVDKTKIAVDIQSEIAGKHLGAKKILSWMREKGLLAKSFYTFGDSGSDYEMAEEIHEQGLPVEYIYVGDISEDDESDPYKGEAYGEPSKKRKIDLPIYRTSQHFSAGTLEYIKQFNSTDQQNQE